MNLSTSIRPVSVPTKTAWTDGVSVPKSTDPSMALTRGNTLIRPSVPIRPTPSGTDSFPYPSIRPPLYRGTGRDGYLSTSGGAK